MSNVKTWYDFALQQILHLLFYLLAALPLLTACTTHLSRDSDTRHPGNIVAMPPDAGKVNPKALAAECAYTGVYGERLDLCARVLAARLPAFDPARPELFGEQYNPRKFYECKAKRSADSACDRFALRRPENPEYWPEGSTRIKWPDPPKESAYREGMNGREYFDALCNAEAGEFIYRAVENVEGIYQIRPRIMQESNHDLMDRYAMEDPYGQYGADHYGYQHKHYVQPYSGKYSFFEKPIATANGVAVKRYYRDKNANPGKTHQTAKDGKFVSLPYLVASEEITKPTARYGYIWRGINRPHDRELGIAGGELAVVDLTTGELLGLRRGFVRSGQLRGGAGFWWLTAQGCEKAYTKSGNFYYLKPDFAFVYEVLKPVAGINDNLERK